MVKRFGELIYSPEEAPEQVISKAETHTPKIEAPDTVEKGKPFTVKIKVGPHPNTVEHSIREIHVYFYEEGRTFNPIHVASARFAPGIAEPEITLVLKLEKSGVLYALSYCNLHGIWEARKEIKVK